MAVVFDAITSSVEGGVGVWEFTHAPVGTPRGVLLLVASSVVDDGIASVTYGGVSMTEVTGSPATEATEPEIVHAFFLGASVPTGAQTVSITKTGATTTDHYCECITFTAAGDMQVTDTSTASGTGANPSVTLSLGGVASYCALVFGSGANAVPTDVDPLTGWTNRRETDTGTRGHGCYTYDTVGTADVTAGISAGSQTYVLLAVAVSEAAASGITGTGALTNSVVTASGTGTIGHVGTGALSISQITSSGTGIIWHTGTGALTATATTLSGSGFLGTGVTGTGGLTISSITVDGVAIRIGWDVAAAASGSWSDVSAAANSWSDATPASGSWTIQ